MIIYYIIYKYHCNVYKLNKNNSKKNELITQPKYQKKPFKQWIMVYAAICNEINIKLPSIIHKQICKQNNDKYSSLSNDYNGTFKCCGNAGNFTSYCCAILVNNAQFSKQYKSNNDDNNKIVNINAFVWDLPLYKKPIDYNVSIFSSKHNALYGLGGWQCNEFYKLSFNHKNIKSLNNKNWNWEKLPSMNEVRTYPPLSLIDNDNNDESTKLIVIGGYAANGETNTVELYDFNLKKWIKIKSCYMKAYQGGSYYHKNKKKVYLAGGQQIGRNNKNASEYLDLVKETWIKLPNMNYRHIQKPILWIEDINNLYVASSTANCIECIDLRQNKNKWKIQHSDISKMFGTRFDGGYTKCHLIG